MSEKRFIRNIVGDIYDSEKDKWFEEDWKGKPLDYDDDLIVFLNEQQATIRKLQDLCGKSDGENAKLRIENKRLKEENKELEDEHDDFSNFLIDKGLEFEFEKWCKDE